MHINPPELALVELELEAVVLELALVELELELEAVALELALLAAPPLPPWPPPPLVPSGLSESWALTMRLQPPTPSSVASARSTAPG